MDLHTLDATGTAQASSAAGAQGTLNTQKATQGKSESSSGDTVSISAEGLAKAAASGTQAASTDSSTTARITKLQKQLQQVQGSSLPDDKKRSEEATLRDQIQMLQSQQPKSGAASASASSSSGASMTTSHA
ncbi:MAG: hypothetical protein P4L39_05475 [Humidesulfovibrio sp.]|nr:hypothetical protein [Humidesulfovibrio sp.]